LVFVLEFLIFDYEDEDDEEDIGCGPAPPRCNYVQKFSQSVQIFAPGSGTGVPPSVAPTSKSLYRGFPNPRTGNSSSGARVLVCCRFGNRRYGRFGNLRYEDASNRSARDKQFLRFPKSRLRLFIRPGEAQYPIDALLQVRI